jgi:hypothetical protein
MTLRFCLTPVRKIIIKKKNTNTGKDAEEKESLYTICGYFDFWKSKWRFLRE